MTVEFYTGRRHHKHCPVVYVFCFFALWLVPNWYLWGLVRELWTWHIGYLIPAVFRSNGKYGGHAILRGNGGWCRISNTMHRRWHRQFTSDVSAVLINTYNYIPLSGTKANDFNTFNIKLLDVWFNWFINSAKHRFLERWWTKTVYMYSLL